jgi:hypothetical protein
MNNFLLLTDDLRTNYLTVTGKEEIFVRPALLHSFSFSI